MKTYDKLTLEKAVKESHNFSELCRSVGMVPSTHTKNILRRNIQNYGLNINHFDSHFFAKQRRIYPVVKKKCPVCGTEFISKLGSKREKKYCSSLCCNSLNLGERHSKQTHLLVSLSLRGRPSPKRGPHYQEMILARQLKSIKTKSGFSSYEKTCKNCGNTFKSSQVKTRCCSRSCSIKWNWKQPEYRQKILSSIAEKVKNGTHKGWTTRNIISYPEQFFKKVLELNGFKDKFQVNHPVSQRSLGLNSEASFFLDFYFPDIKVDLEIDGKQHTYPDRIISDKIRNEALTKNGYIVYRIQWKQIQTNKDYFKEEIKKLLEFLNSQKIVV
jgi:very-short-patch-repair endonuclease